MILSMEIMVAVSVTVAMVIALVIVVSLGGEDGSECVYCKYTGKGIR